MRCFHLPPVFFFVALLFILCLALPGCAKDPSAGSGQSPSTNPGQGDDDSDSDESDDGDPAEDGSCVTTVDAPGNTISIDYLFEPVKAIYVEPAHARNPLARRIWVTTNISVSLGGRVTHETEPGYGPSSPKASPEGTEHAFWFYGLLPESRFHLTLYLNGNPRTPLAAITFLTPALPANHPSFQILAGGSVSHHDWFAICLRVKGPERYYILILDPEGRFRFFHEAPADSHFIEVLSNGDIAFSELEDIRAVRPDGSEYVYVPVDLSDPVFIAPHHGFHVDENSGGATVIYNSLGPGLMCDLITPTDRAAGDGFVELDAAGNELLRWTVFDHQDEIPPEAMDPVTCFFLFFGFGAYDWTHANEVVPIPGQDAYLLSMRNVSRVIKVRRDTGEIEWQMGKDLDFTWLSTDLPEPAWWFFFQHDPHWLPGPRLLVFDNSLYRDGDFLEVGLWSRALELSFDENDRTVSQIWEYRVPFSISQGNVQRRDNGNTLIASGASGQVLEVPPFAEPGEKIIHWSFGINPVRALYYPSLWNYEEETKD